MKMLQKITSVFLAVTLLVSSLGFTANKMVCLKSGKIKFSLVHAKDCCPEKRSSTPVVKGQCCDLINTTFHLGNFQNGQKLTIQQHLGSIGLFYTSLFSSKLNSITESSVISFGDLPPPLSGREILSRISTLII